MAKAHITNPNFFKRNRAEGKTSVRKTTDKLGIGTNDPTEKLHVVGNALIETGDLYARNVNYNEGLLADPTIEDATGSAVSISSVACLIRSNDEWDGDGKLYYKVVPADTALAMTDSAINYIYVDWNSGSPIYKATTNRDTINNSNYLPVARLNMSSGNICDKLLYEYIGRAAAVRNFDRVMRTRGVTGIERESGLTISETATRVVNIAAGFAWFGLSRKTLDAIVMAGAGVTSRLWYHSGGNWTSANITQYNNTQYDNGTNLATLTANRYAVNWVFRNVGSNIIDIVLGAGDYTQAQAEASMLPALPGCISNFAVLCGRIIVQKSSDTAYAIENVTNTSFAQASITTHNDLGGLQGGTAGEYYHLTEAKKIVVDNTSGTNTGDQTIQLTGDVTGSGTGSFAATIANKAVSLAKMADLAANSIIGNNTISPATPIALTATQVRTLINVADGANNYVHPNHTGDVTSVADGATTIANKAVSLAKMADLAANSIIGNNTGGAAVPKALTILEVQTMLSVLSNPMTTLGDIIYGGASGVATRLAGNTNATRKFLAQTGDGANSAAPEWYEINPIGGSTGATDNAILRANGAGGATVQSSLVTIDDDGSINIPTGEEYLINSVNIKDVTETLTNKTLTAPKFANGGFIADNSGNEQIEFTTTASAVNHIGVKNGATGNPATLEAKGGDTNIDLEFAPKGTGRTKMDTDVTIDTVPIGVSLEAEKGLGYFVIPEKLNAYVLKKVYARVHKPSSADDIELQLTRERKKGAIGDSTTQFDITNPSGDTWRYTYDSTGTDPQISTNVAVGDQIYVQAANFDGTNNGLYTVTAVNTNYFEVLHITGVGVAETNKTIGAGIINVITCKSMLSTTTKIPDLYFDNSGDTSYVIDASYDDVLTNDIIRIDCLDNGTGSEGLVIWLTFKKA